MSATCDLTLVRNDQRTPERMLGSFSFSRRQDGAYKDADSAHTVACDFFGIVQTWDKELFKSFLHEDTDQFNWFYLVRNDQFVSYEVIVKGDRTILIQDPQKKHEALPQEYHLSLSVRKYSKASVASNIDGEFTFEGMKDLSLENSIVSFFNSESFKSFKEYNLNLLFTRSFEKISPKLSKL